MNARWKAVWLRYFRENLAQYERRIANGNGFRSDLEVVAHFKDMIKRFEA